VQEYEILVAGPIGPVVASCLPGFTTVAVPTATVLTGAVASPDDLLGVINLLTAHGLEPIDIRINAHHAAKKPSTGAEGQAPGGRSQGTVGHE